MKLHPDAKGISWEAWIQQRHRTLYCAGYATKAEMQQYCEEQLRKTEEREAAKATRKKKK